MRNVVVTGGSRGLGLAIGAALAAGGDRVIAVARSQTPQLQAAAADCGRTGTGQLLFRAFDLAETGALAPFVRGLRKDFGPLYGLVNNAGIGSSGVLATMRDAELGRLVHLNVTSPMLLTKYVLRSMMTERAGRIVNMASVVASAGYAGLSAYAATKAAMIGFTKSLAREVGPLGITVNAVAPGFIDTAMTRDLSEDDRERVARRSALRRLADPQDVAGAVSYLFSEAARNITGVTLNVDAGGGA